MTHDIVLAGCRPEPLMSYLKALGVLRLVSGQKDSEACAWWDDDVLQLRSVLDKEGLLSFFGNEYMPTPIVAPWSGGSGFFKKDNKQFVDALASNTLPRCKLFAEVIRLVRAIIRDEKVDEKPAESLKARLIERYRRELPDQVVEWMDAAMVLQNDGQVFAPLLGTGGNDGRLDFTQNFMGRLVTLGLAIGEPHPKSSEWLRNALFGETIDGLQNAAVGQFAPGKVGGPNATQGMEGTSLDNPWDFVLMLEGGLTFAGAAVRRLASGDNSLGAFPFTVRASNAGYGSAADSDTVNSRGELWLPLWRRPVNFAELRTLFAEGRATVSGRPVRTGVDFARAVATLGVDRGLDRFSRFCFLRRSGKAYLATALGQLEVRDSLEIGLLREIDPWLDSLRRSANEDAPPRFKAALRRIDEAVFDLCRYGGPAHFAELLCALGSAERELAPSEGWLTWTKPRRRLQPLAGLSQRWITAANDGSVEFELALALAGIHDAECKIGPVRANFEPVSVGTRKGGGQYVTWGDQNRGVVWNASDLPTNLAAILQRRMLDSERANCTNLPLAFRVGASIEAIATFLAAAVDEARIGKLLCGLVLVDQGGPEPPTKFPKIDAAPLRRAYALLKLLFLPGPLVVESRNERRIRIARNNETGIRIAPEPRVLSLLRAGRLDEACRIAAWRLRASGLAPAPIDWRGVRGGDSLRVAAALLIPIRDRDLGALVNLVARFEEAAVA